MVTQISYYNIRTGFCPLQSEANSIENRYLGIYLFICVYMYHGVHMQRSGDNPELLVLTFPPPETESLLCFLIPASWTISLHGFFCLCLPSPGKGCWACRCFYMGSKDSNSSHLACEQATLSVAHLPSPCGFSWQPFLLSHYATSGITGGRLFIPIAET